MTYYTAIIIIVWFALLVLSILVFENNRICEPTRQLNNRGFSFSFLNKVGAAWKGKAAKGVSFSIGSATRVDNPKLQFGKLVILADQRMYKGKDNYYRSTGLERREY